MMFEINATVQITSSIVILCLLECFKKILQGFEKKEIIVVI